MAVVEMAAEIGLGEMGVLPDAAHGGFSTQLLTHIFLAEMMIGYRLPRLDHGRVDIAAASKTIAKQPVVFIMAADEATHLATGNHPAKRITCRNAAGIEPAVFIFAGLIALGRVYRLEPHFYFIEKDRVAVIDIGFAA